jgi:RNA polymerase sigma-70 factor (ECF subfamily)
MTTEEFKSRLLPAKNKLYRFAFSLLSNREEAEDAVQEVYLKMWDMRNDLGQYKSTEALMMTITRNHCLDKLKVKKNKAYSLNTEYNKSTTDDVQKKTEQSDLIQKVKMVMQKLPEQQRTIVHLRDVEGYDYDEILKITGYEMNYVRVNLSRGRKKIRETINHLQSYESERY